MKDVKPTMRWAEEKLRKLSEQGFTGSVTLRFAQGGVQSMLLSQELHPKQESQLKAQDGQITDNGVSISGIVCSQIDT